VDLRKRDWKDVDWRALSHDTEYWKPLVNMEVKLGVP
jgi:hypothetical protein